MWLDLLQSFRMRVGCAHDRWTKRSGTPRIVVSMETAVGTTSCEVIEAAQTMIPQLERSDC
jgi:hypothetical protein